MNLLGERSRPRFPFCEPPNLLEPCEVEHKARDDKGHSRENSPSRHSIRNLGDNSELITQASGVYEKPGDDKKQGKKSLDRPEVPSIALSNANQKPPQVQEGRARLPNNEPGEHERAKVVRASDHSAREEGQMMQNGIKTSQLGILSEDVDQVCTQVRPEHDICEEDAGGLTDVGEGFGGESGGERGRRVLQLDVDGGVEQDAEVFDSAGGDEDCVDGGEDVGGGLAEQAVAD